MFLDFRDETMAVFQWGIVICTSLVAAGFDVRQGRIPNALTIPMLAVGLIWFTLLSGLAGLVESLGACALLAFPFVILFIFFGGGAGDAKLMGAIGAWLGLKYGLFALVCVIFAGGGLAIIKAISQRRLKFVITSIFVSFYTFILFLIGQRTMRPAYYGTEIERKGNLELPYGVAIFSGVSTAAVIVGIWGVEWI